MSKKMLFVIGMLLLAAFALTACQGEAGPPGPAGPEGPQGEQGEPGEPGQSLTMADLTCTECHNDTNIITGKETAWAESGHGMGEAYVRGTSARCAGCHSGSGFTAMVTAGLSPEKVEVGDPNPTRQDCRTCHEIHTTYTGDDWALTTTEPVNMVMLDATFDGGTGNLCASCHQPFFNPVPAGDADGNVEVGNSHWGPHHGPQSAMLMGMGGAGVEGKAAGHYTLAENTCVGCHVGENANHGFEPDVAACTECHADTEDFDVNGAQTEIVGLMTDLQDALVSKGLLDEDGHPVPGTYSEAQATALWNYLFVMEDKSTGVHNPAYAKALLEAGQEALQ